MTKKTNAYTKGESEATLLLAIHAPYNYSDFEPYKEEFINLARTNEIETEHIISIKLRSINPPYFLTTGKLDDLLEYCNEHKIKRVVISEQLTANQERNLSEFLRCSIIDRTLLILEIFEKLSRELGTFDDPIYTKSGRSRNVFDFALPQ
jgi:50S ribosomal subunit-associated GTPase HflX